MALSKPALSALIKNNIQSIDGVVVKDATQLQKFSDAIANAIIDHIKAAAVVSVITSGVQAGGSSLPGTGTIS